MRRSVSSLESDIFFAFIMSITLVLIDSMLLSGISISATTPFSFGCSITMSKKNKNQQVRCITVKFERKTNRFAVEGSSCFSLPREDG